MPQRAENVGIPREVIKPWVGRLWENMIQRKSDRVNMSSCVGCPSILDLSPYREFSRAQEGPGLLTQFSVFIAPSRVVQCTTCRTIGGIAYCGAQETQTVLYFVNRSPCSMRRMEPTTTPVVAASSRLTG
jgi:hypothetical protein